MDAGSPHRPSDPPGRRSRKIRLPSRWSASPRLRSFALEGVRIRVHLADPPAKATTGDLNGGGESRPTSQLVGSGATELEQRADVTGADQLVPVTSPLPGDFRCAAGRFFGVWQKRHGQCRIGRLRDGGTWRVPVVRGLGRMTHTAQRWGSFVPGVVIGGLALPVSRVLPSLPEVVVSLTVSEEKQATNITVIYHREIKIRSRRLSKRPNRRVG